MKSFTLIEIVIAMLVVGIIGLAVAPKLMDVAREARMKNENSALGNILTGIDLVQLENRTRNISPAYPAHLDSANTGAASGSNPVFGNVLRAAITSAWEKTAADRYKGPTGQEYEYNPNDGTFLAYSGGGGGGLPIPSNGFDFSRLNSTYDYSVSASSGVALSGYGISPAGIYRFSNGDLGIVTGVGAEHFDRYAPDGTRKYRTSNLFWYGYNNMAEASDGSLVVIDGLQRKLHKIDASGNPSLFYDGGASVTFETMAQMPNGNIALLDTLNSRVLEVSSSTGNLVSTLYSNVPLSFHYMSFTPDGTIYLADTTKLFKGSPGGQINQLAAFTYPARSISTLPNGDVLVVDASTNQINRHNGTTGAYAGVAALVGEGYSDIRGLQISSDGKAYTIAYPQQGARQAIELSFPVK